MNVLSKLTAQKPSIDDDAMDHNGTPFSSAVLGGWDDGCHSEREESDTATTRLKPLTLAEKAPYRNLFVGPTIHGEEIGRGSAGLAQPYWWLFLRSRGFAQHASPRHNRPFPSSRVRLANRRPPQAHQLSTEQAT